VNSNTQKKKKKRERERERRRDDDSYHTVMKTGISHACWFVREIRFIWHVPANRPANRHSSIERHIIIITVMNSIIQGSSEDPQQPALKYKHNIIDTYKHNLLTELLLYQEV
jgi:hypothetical protein